jgi:hypothetical protein
MPVDGHCEKPLKEGVFSYGLNTDETRIRKRLRCRQCMTQPDDRTLPKGLGEIGYIERGDIANCEMQIANWKTKRVLAESA